MVSITSCKRGGTKLLNRAGASGKETRARYTCLISEEKGDTPTQCASPIQGEGTHTLTRRVSFLLNIHKKKCQQIILHTVLHVPSRNIWLFAHVHAHVQMATQHAKSFSTALSSSCLRSLKSFDYHGFKSW
jgi:hypothetical protein